LEGKFKNKIEFNGYRGTESENVVEKRMNNAIGELDKARTFGIYQNFIINEEISGAFKTLLDFINRNYPGLNLS